MSDYENGITTRKDIVTAAQRLFYQKGFHETSLQDICHAAHVNRGTVYYHFKSREMIRYEVLWNFTMEDKRIAERYCDREDLHFLLALCISWIRIGWDDRFRKFMYDYCTDCPVFTGQMDLSLYHTTLYQCMWGRIWKRDKIPEISFDSVYGYLISFCLMLCRDPEKYDPVDAFIHCNNTCVTMWGIPLSRMDAMWMDFRRQLEKIPPEAMKIRLPDEKTAAE